MRYFLWLFPFRFSSQLPIEQSKLSWSNIWSFPVFPTEGGGSRLRLMVRIVREAPFKNVLKLACLTDLKICWLRLSETHQVFGTNNRTIKTSSYCLMTVLLPEHNPYFLESHLRLCKCILSYMLKITESKTTTRSLHITV